MTDTWVMTLDHLRERYPQFYRAEVEEYLTKFGVYRFWMPYDGGMRQVTVRR